jgi:hypothetical protein
LLVFLSAIRNIFILFNFLAREWKTDQLWSGKVHFTHLSITNHSGMNLLGSTFGVQLLSMAFIPVVELKFPATATRFYILEHVLYLWMFLGLLLLGIISAFLCLFFIGKWHFRMIFASTILVVITFQ